MGKGRRNCGGGRVRGVVTGRKLVGASLLVTEDRAYYRLAEGGVSVAGSKAIPPGAGAEALAVAGASTDGKTKRFRAAEEVAARGIDRAQCAVMIRPGRNAWDKLFKAARAHGVTIARDGEPLQAGTDWYGLNGPPAACTAVFDALRLAGRLLDYSHGRGGASPFAVGSGAEKVWPQAQGMRIAEPAREGETSPRAAARAAGRRGVALAVPERNVALLPGRKPAWHGDAQEERESLDSTRYPAPPPPQAEYKGDSRPATNERAGLYSLPTGGLFPAFGAEEQEDGSGI